VAVLLVLSLAPPQRILSRPDHGDIVEYYRYTQHTFEGQVPYRDFSLEYPPGALPALLAAGPADGGYYNRFRVLMLALGAAAILLLAAAMFLAGADAAELAAGVLLPATLPVTLNPGLVFERFDFWPAALVLLAVVALLRGRRTLGLVALGVGAVAKLYPLTLVPLALLARRGRAHVRRELAVGAAAALAFALPFVVLAPRGVGHVGSLLVRRPLHAESLGGSILLASHRLGFYKPTTYLSIGNSWDLAGPAAKVVAVASSLAEAAALLAVWFFFARSRRGPREFLLAVAAAVIGFVAFGKVFSPQYMVWVVTAVPLALGRVRPFALAATAAALLLTLYEYDYGAFELLRGERVSWLMLTRNLILVGLFCSLLAELAMSGRQPAPGPAGAVARSDSAPP
jgi:uncharacterized membrane protein